MTESVETFALYWDMLGALLLSAMSPIVLYATERGNDDWTGTQRRPFRTIQRLQRELLIIRSKGDLRPASIQLRGRFEITEPIVLGPEFNDSSIEGKALISGGKRLIEWQTLNLYGREVWSTDVGDQILRRQLFVGDARRPIARLPKQGFYRLSGLTNGAEGGPWNVGQDEAIVAPSERNLFANIGSADFVAHHYWIQSRMRLTNFDAGTGTARFDRKSVFRLTDDYTGQAAPYRLENVIQGLTEPGEWVSDPERSRILYRPKLGERIERFSAVVGSLPTLLFVRNVRKLTLKDIDFRHAEWQPPQESAGDPQAAISTPGAVILENSVGCTLKACQVRNAGTYGIEILNGQDNAILGCDLTDLGGGGVKVGHGSVRTKVVDCAMVGLGRIFAPAVGVWIGNSGGNLVSHNLIRDLYYTGVSVGWSWGYGPSDALDNVVEYNDIRNLGHGELSDMGGIYTLGVSPGTVLHHNRIQDIEARGYGGWGIYLDEGSTGIVVENNLVRNTKTGGFHQHYGRDNLIQNNVFMNARTEGQLIRTRAEDHKSFSIERNVVIWQDANLFGSNWGGYNFSVDNNLYWRTDGKSLEVPGGLEEWKKRGFDVNSRFEDPKMRISDSGVRFDRSSPAAEIGIKPIDLSKVGPRRMIMLPTPERERIRTLDRAKDPS